MVNLVISYWFFALPIGVYLAFNEIGGLPNEAEGIWVGMIIGITLSAILNTGRLKFKKGYLRSSVNFEPIKFKSVTTDTPALSRALNLSWAVPLPPEIIAPACPILFPFGAVTPAI